MLREILHRLWISRPKLKNYPVAVNFKDQLIPNSDRKFNYFGGLEGPDRNHLFKFIELAEELSRQIQPTQLALTVFGSSIKPESMRSGPINDLDLRFLNSEPPGKTREAVVDFLCQQLESYLQKNGLKYEFASYTDNTIYTPAEAYDDESKTWVPEIVGHIDYSNTDPSFRVFYPDGLSVHISISGNESLPLETHLQREATFTYPAILLFPY